MAVDPLIVDEEDVPAKHIIEAKRTYTDVPAGTKLKIKVGDDVVYNEDVAAGKKEEVLLLVNRIITPE